MSQADTSTVRMGSEQAAGVDDVAARMTVQVHEVALGKHHGSIKFKPENQEKYKNDARFKPDPSDGELYVTIGAGPEKGKLVSRLNREKDFDQSNKILETIPIVSIEQEDAVFQELIKLDSNYKDNLEYDLFPNPNKVKTIKTVDVEIGGTEPDDVFPPMTIKQERQSSNQWGDSYNSNSYWKGLLNAADVPVSKIELDMPGQDKPVPKKIFQE